MFKQNARRFIVRVLGNEVALEGPLENALAKARGAFQVGGNLGFGTLNE